MSRIGIQPIVVLSGVEVSIEETNNIVRVKGPKGELQKRFSGLLRIEKTDEQPNKILVVPKNKNSKSSKMLWGLTRTLISNMIKGVSDGFDKKLQIEGVGYRANAEGGKKIVLNLGFSHPVEVIAPENIEFKVEKNIITVFGINKELVGQVAANIRSLRKPEPYKGKGIRYVGEVVRRKAGKKAVASSK